MGLRKPRIAVIGGGTWGNHHLMAAKQLEAEGKVELVAIADQHEATAARQVRWERLFRHEERVS